MADTLHVTNTGIHTTEFKKHIELYKQVAPVIRWGDMYRLWSPFKVKTYNMDCS